MAASASSLALSSFNPKSIPFCVFKSASISLLPLSVSFKLPSEPLSVSLLASSAVKCLASGEFPSRFVRNVAVSSDFEVEEDGVFGDDAEEEPGFSPDLKLFVGNLPFTVDSSQLAELFESAGNVQMVEVIYDKITGRSRGFGFVTMSTVEEVESAAQQFNGYEYEGRPLRVNSGPPPPRREESFSRGPRSRSSFQGSDSGPRSSFPGSGSGSSNRVYVGNLSWAVDDMALESLFNEQGKVVEARVIYDRDSGRSKGFGFVTYNSPQEVNNAIRSLNGADLDGRQIRVSVAESRPPRRQF
ncbi:PREDICTED: RNA-binding protein CP29B, chloroplastic-like [Tarenaya hassleriana]|uniref:RNA-binding protein CP29B, chloroplastic-like n=1 Tax=Tarenaya hassleriana TaxID=28532 RepID=UPI00053C7914|nr:PREDICTED: RNA-binding protein CP29B, chloroplastic-like [Tarenaya hassleriana]XP_010529883.1 PREDICTED: RNA-binding protein CP29B, chloroplastic-like [Tarenaya hassleriana]XP_019057258.1 PREDICTED: RNA-binding protein CP29B, chloroplastic-like [Tarenaya hassleriana]